MLVEGPSLRRWTEVSKFRDKLVQQRKVSTLLVRTSRKKEKGELVSCRAGG
jgi:hypothetical protein